MAFSFDGSFRIEPVLRQLIEKPLRALKGHRAAWPKLLSRNQLADLNAPYIRSPLDI
jgi:hypothetical protein